MNRFRPNVDSLDQRINPAANYNVLTNGTLVINCDNANDTIRIRQTNTQVVLNGQVAFKANAITGIIVNGNGGNDVIDVEGVNKPATLNGGAGNDWLVGGNINDALNGGPDRDTLFGWNGNDVIHGDGGNDRLYGNAGYDYLYGDDGSDFMDDGVRGSEEYYDGGSGYDFIADIWAINGTATSDIMQGQLGTCSFLAGLAAGCDAGINYANWISYRGYDASGQGLYDVTLWNPSSQQWFTKTVGFDGLVNMYDTHTALSAADRVQEYEFWPVLMQRTYINTINSANVGVALSSATGGASTWWNPSHYNAKSAIITALNSNRPVSALIGGTAFLGLQNHTVAVVAARGSAAAPELLIYNPWGRDAYNGSQMVAVDGVNDGYFWVNWNTFQYYFASGFWVR